MKSAQNDSSRSIARLLFASLFAFALAAPEARAAVPADFAKTFTVTVPAGLVDAGETLTSFPLLLRLGTGISGFDYADFQQAGADILVRDANGNALPYELENWDTAGESRLWVRVPSVAAGTTLTVYYGTAEAVAPPAGVWSGYAGVWHFNEAGDGATTIADSTANAQNGTSHASSKARSDGKLGAARGLELDAKNGAMTTVPSSAVLDVLVPTFTVSGWVRPKTLSLNWAISSRARRPTRTRPGACSSAQAETPTPSASIPTATPTTTATGRCLPQAASSRRTRGRNTMSSMTTRRSGSISTACSSPPNRRFQARPSTNPMDSASAASRHRRTTAPSRPTRTRSA